MELEIEFEELNQELLVDMGEVYNVSDGGYERGYAEGLAKREYETWTITYTDGTTEEKEVALL